MDIAIAIVIGVLLTGALLWRLLQPSPETAWARRTERAEKLGRLRRRERRLSRPAKAQTKASRREEGPRALRPSR
jgi:hypothetical protein